jgi:hypothetical protein
MIGLRRRTAVPDKESTRSTVLIVARGNVLDKDKGQGS